jgi:hypothetical protein
MKRFVISYARTNYAVTDPLLAYGGYLFKTKASRFSYFAQDFVYLELEALDY